MDRNGPICGSTIRIEDVALRKESVDRNIMPDAPDAPGAGVALRKESVDRNVFGFGAKLVHSVALRKESVDRNIRVNKTQRAASVALRKESVDRNTQRRDFKRLGLRRSPQGERG